MRVTLHPTLPSGRIWRRTLDLVELIMELEEQFGMEIPDEEAEKITTVEEAVDYVMEHQAA